MKITADGFYTIKHKQSGAAGAITIVYVSGTAGGSVLTLGYYDDYHTFIPFIDGVLSVDTQSIIKHGIGVVPVLSVTGASGTALSIITASMG